MTRLPASVAASGQPCRQSSLASQNDRASQPATPAPNRPGPSCTATRRTASSTGRPSPDDLVAEAAALGLRALAITDHDGMYGVPQFAQAAARFTQQTGVKLGTVFGAELSLELPARARTASPTRSAATCWCSPATPRDTGGCAG